MHRSEKASVVAVVLVLAGYQSVAAPGPGADPGPGTATATGTQARHAAAFANPDLLVETEWLAGHLRDERVRVLDARSEEKFAAGHIPGAISVTSSDVYDPDREPGNMVGPPEQIAKRFGDKGIDEYAHVIVYDEGRATSAARVFWTLEYYGHPNVSVLNGGITKWQAEGREISTDAPSLRPVTFTVRVNSDVISTRDEVEGDLAEPNVVTLDVRTDEEFTGEEARAERGGHIPGAVHIEWTRNFTEGEAPVFKPAFQLASMYEDQGVTRDKRVHAY